MSWYDIASLGATVRPLSGERPRLGERVSPFTAGFSDTIDLLARELTKLGARSIVIGLDMRERDIRLDGFPRADARPASPAVEVAFESKWGPLRYATSEFTHWQDNLRAIALSMEALRKVDRYGVSKRGEQYRGWRAIPMSTADPADAIVTAEDAHAVLAEWGGDVRAALYASHPDHGGDDVMFRKVLRARDLVG